MITFRKDRKIKAKVYWAETGRDAGKWELYTPIGKNGGFSSCYDTKEEAVRQGHVYLKGLCALGGKYTVKETA